MDSMTNERFDEIRQWVKEFEDQHAKNNRPILGKKDTKTYKKRVRKQTEMRKFIDELMMKKIRQKLSLPEFLLFVKKQAEMQRTIEIDAVLYPLLTQAQITEEELIELAHKPVSEPQKMSRDRLQEVRKDMPNLKQHGISSEELTLWAMWKLYTIEKIRG